MDSGTQFPQPSEDEPQFTLPPKIVLNPRRKIEPEEIPAAELVRRHKEKDEDYALVWCSADKPNPVPKNPLSISWQPERMYFEIDKKPVERKLWVSNRSKRPIYIHICGLWDDTANLGAGWHCYPRTRMLLAPGLIYYVYVRATPRSESPVPCAFAGLQLATAHLHDTIIGYFVVPIEVKFKNYVTPDPESELSC